MYETLKINGLLLKVRPNRDDGDLHVVKAREREALDAALVALEVPVVTWMPPRGGRSRSWGAMINNADLDKLAAAAADLDKPDLDKPGPLDDEDTGEDTVGLMLGW